jgi:Flp pilus assembly protein TadD
VNTGTIHLLQGDLEKAEASFLLAKEIAKLPEALDGLACVAFLRGDFERAEEGFTWIIEQFPDYAAVYGNAALLLEAQGKKEQARAYYLRALELDPENAAARNNFAVHLKEASQGEEIELESLRQLGQAYAVYENNPVIKDNISIIRESRNEREENKRAEFEF